MNTTDRARAYLAKLPPAIAGQSGHAATFAAACRLVEFGLSSEEAFAVFAEWNESHCQPPWTEQALRHKLADAFKRTHPKCDFTTATRRVTATARNASSGAGGSQRSAHGHVTNYPHVRTAEGCIKVPHIETERVPRRDFCPETQEHPRLPDFARCRLTPGNAGQFAAVSTMRHVSLEAVALARERGLLQFGLHRGAAAWFVLDASQRIAQARRMDGKRWFDDVKAVNVADSKARWPVGMFESIPFRTVMLVEGGPDLLAAFHFILREGREHDCAPVAILGACNPIHAAALPLFTGKRVRIYGHNDSAGEKAVARWAAQLQGIADDVDAFSFAGLPGVNDLNDLTRLHPDVASAHPSLSAIIP